MTEKIKVPKAKVMASDAQFVTYMDEGGALKKARATQVEVIDGDAPAAPSTSSAETTAAATDGPSVDSNTDPEPTEASPPPSDRPPASKSGAPVSPQPKQSRKKTMATAQASTAAKKKAAPPKAKVAAKKAVRTEPSGIRTIGGKAVNLDGYEKVKTPAGGTSYHNGDAVAERLAGKSLEEAYGITAKALKEDVKALQKKYAHLNVGMQRMALGNRLRKVLIPKEAKN